MTKIALELELADIDVVARALMHWRKIQQWGLNSRMASDGERAQAQSDIDRINKMLGGGDENADDPNEGDDGLRGPG
jgi:hypothetical protein